MFGREPKPKAPQTRSEQIESEIHEKFGPTLDGLKKLAQSLHSIDYEFSTDRASALRVAFNANLSDQEMHDLKEFIDKL